MNRWKQTAVVLTVVVSVLSGCGFIVEERPPQQGANESAPGVVQSSPRTGLNCCQGKPKPPGALGSACPGISTDIHSAGFKTKGKAWLHPRTGEYCAEEGGSVGFPNRPLIEGPKEGNSYKERGKHVCYTGEDISRDVGCNHDLKGSVLWLTRRWFQGQCNNEEVRQFLKDRDISLEAPRWENCDAAGNWRGIALPK